MTYLLTSLQFTILLKERNGYYRGWHKHCTLNVPDSRPVFTTVTVGARINFPFPLPVSVSYSSVHTLRNG